MTCTRPPDLPCRPGCPGWVVEHGKYLQACAACDHFPANDTLWAIEHLIECAWCRDKAEAEGALEAHALIIQGLDFEEVPGGWTAHVCMGLGAAHRIVSTAVYPTRDEARAAGRAWEKRLRGF